MPRSLLVEKHLDQSAQILAQSISALDRIRESMRGDSIFETTSLRQIAEARALLHRAWVPGHRTDGSGS